MFLCAVKILATCHAFGKRANDSPPLLYKYYKLCDLVNDKLSISQRLMEIDRDRRNRRYII